MSAVPLVRVKDSIAIKLFKVVFSIYFGLTLFMTVAHMYAEYQSTKTNIFKELKSLQQTFEPGLAKAIWDMNPEQLEPTLKGMVQFPSVVGVKLQENSLNQVYSEGLIQSETNTDESQGEIMNLGGLTGLFSYHFPIRYTNKKKEMVLGQATIYSSSNIIFDQVKVGFVFIVGNAIIKTIALWIIFLWVSRYMLSRPLSILTEAASKLSLGTINDFKIDIKITGRHELKILEEAFNTMVETIRQETNRFVSLNRTFQKFVPKQFIERIGTRGVESIEIGTVVADYVTILFTDIRSFTTLSEGMLPKDVFAFLNSYLSRMEPSIQKNKGFVDKFLGDGIMALFDTGSDRQEAQSGVNAAIAMQKALTLYNEHRQKVGYVPIQTGIGIHSGNVMIGTVGSDKRMESTAIGDAVNLASRLEGLTKYYNCKIIISEKTFQLLENTQTFYWRKLDKVLVKGKKEAVNIYEIFDADADDIRDRKAMLLEPYHAALEHYYEQQWDSARELFNQCLELHPEDVVCQMYLSRIYAFEVTPPETNWQGEIRLETK